MTAETLAEILYDATATSCATWLNADPNLKDEFVTRARIMINHPLWTVPAQETQASFEMINQINTILSRSQDQVNNLLLAPHR